jgi:hypothetical protein
MWHDNLLEIKQLPIMEVAARLGIRVLRGKKAMCFGGHDRLTPSLSFVPTKNIWKCFGCELKGDAVGLVMNVLGCDFKAALEWFTTEFGVNVKGGRGRRRYGLGTRWLKLRPMTTRPQRETRGEEGVFSPDPELYAWLLQRCGVVSETVGLNYLRDHGIPLEVANRFGLRELRAPSRALRGLIEHWGARRVLRSGLAWGHPGEPRRLIWSTYALLFPFYSAGKISYVQARLFEGSAKYLGSRGIPKPLYNLDEIRALPAASTVHICEGVPDAVALEGHGLHAVGVLGASSFRPEWFRYFERHDVVVVPDGDRGGEVFCRMIARSFKARGKAVRVLRVPQGKDVADVIAEIRRRK